jgi:hypothetical protein
LFFEPDGSFVWTSPPDRPRWQIDGCLFDRGGRVHYVELRGGCPPAELDCLLSSLGWPEAGLMFQLPEQGVWLPEEEFRRLHTA